MEFKTILFTFLIIILSGCSDDDCPVCPDDNKQEVIIMGRADLLGSTLYVNLEATELDGKPVPIDSVTADSTTLTKNVSFYIPKNRYSFRDDSNDYQGGEIVYFKIYANNDVCSASLKLYNDSDLVEMYNWETGKRVIDSIGLNEPLPLYWSDNLGADFYEIVYQYLYDSSGSNYEQPGSYQTQDTSFIIGSDRTTFNGVYTMHLFAANGPMDNEPGNIVGNTIKGKLISYTTQEIAIVVGDGLSDL